MTDSGMMRVYHFCDEVYGLQNIEKSRLKVATIMDLNDPFEMVCYSSPDKDVRKKLNDFKRVIASKFGLLCFSQSFRSPVQWAHYANKHKGLCLAFDVPKHNMHFVEYKFGRIGFDVAQYADLDKRERSEMMQKQLRIKHSQWRYEREVRRIFLLSDADHEKGLYFRSFDSIGTLSQVIVGCNSDIGPQDLNQQLGARKDSVECFKVRTAFQSYKIVRNKDGSLWR
ncbi:MULTISPECIES: DUF2971 domain-containing protein [Pseudomonas]|uniref:DUF2971 domain-containing protein n=1 Tax=Pseudomonas TaxID=286 RepID=UPI000B3549FB|nr:MULTISPECIES: DUF2971 domain-containing protein [Pseudomonas]PMY71015.1 methylaspartate mutase subunit S [Pseudomonas sp. FW305-25]PMY75544.1 methylaspartate mutase subunit S [Pseudomonas sp. FW126-L8]PNA81434.1 methylaspartate mutase subunit S [Pseudomonas sp. FW305-76]